ncbi:MAG: lamin tail domain-containing protein, partial [Candidatus Andersenbacteria bacterium]
MAIFLFLPPTPLHAAVSPIVINEIMWDGVEYIELHNTTPETIGLTGWTLARQQLGSSPKTIVTFTEGDNIAANDFYLITKNEAATSVTPDKIISSLTLVNTGELLTLTNDEAVLIDSANQLAEWFAGRNTETGSAMERTNAALAGT